MTNDAAAELLLPSTLPTLAPEAMPKIARVVIVACGKAKLDHAAQAQDLYVGGLFKAARAHAEATASRWFVASAKHGLIAPELVIAPYDQKLGSGSATRFVKDTTIDTWAENCRAQFVALMGEHGLDGVIVEILAGADYPHGPPVRPRGRARRRWCRMSSHGHDELRRWREQGRAPAGSCPFCASRISVIERDGVFVARCSHRGCGARGPRHHDLTRACDLFCCPPQRTAGGMGGPDVGGAL